LAPFEISLANGDLPGLVASLHATHPPVSVVVLSNTPQNVQIGPALNAAGVISKNQPPECLLALLQTTGGPTD
jgi:hypothetical protein